MLKFIKSNIFFLILLTVAAFCLYGKTINFGFTYGDDTNLILERAEFLSDIKNAPTVFTTSCYYSKDFSYYRPLLNLSFMAETLLFGINTHIYHITNIILFILSLYLMYLFSQKLLKKCTMYNVQCTINDKTTKTPDCHADKSARNDRRDTILKCLFLLIAVHPLFTSAVAWIPARNDTLLAVFMYASLIFFIDYLENKKTKDLVLYFIFFALSLLTKESFILAVLLYAALIWCLDYKITKRQAAVNLLIFVPMAVAYLYLRHLAVSGSNLFSYLTQFGDILKNMLVGSAVYLYQFVVPDIHVMLYNVKFNFVHFVVLLLIILFICFSLYKNFINKKVFIWCVLLFCLFIFPTCLLDDYIILNHRLVVVIPAVVIVLAMIVEKIINFKRVRISLFFLFVFVFVAFSGTSFSFQNNYRDKNIYWYQSYLDAPDCHATCYWIGRLFFEIGRYDKAKEFFIKANDLKPIYLSDMALVYYFEGNLDKAEEFYKGALQTGVNVAQCYRNLSTIYYQRDKDLDKAIKFAEMAVQKEPLEYEYGTYLRALINEKNKNTL